MKPAFILPTLALAAVHALMPAQAALLIDVDRIGGPALLSPAVGMQSAYVSHFRLSQAFDSLNIEALLGSTQPGLAGEALLMNAIGPGTGAASELAHRGALFFPTFSSISLPPAHTTVFSGLSLEPGDYYLVIRTPTQGATGPLGWFVGDDVTEEPGADLVGNFVRLAPEPYAPASSFSAFDTTHLRIRLTGELRPDDPAAVPEPSSLLLLGLGLALAGTTARRKGHADAARLLGEPDPTVAEALRLLQS